MIHKSEFMKKAILHERWKQVQKGNGNLIYKKLFISFHSLENHKYSFSVSFRFVA